MESSVHFSLCFSWRKGNYWIKTSFPLPWASQSLPDSVCRGFIRISRFDHLFAAKTFQSDPIQDPVWIIDNSIEESEIGRDEAARRGWKVVVKSIQNPLTFKLWFIFILNGTFKSASKDIPTYVLNTMHNAHLWLIIHMILETFHISCNNIILWDRCNSLCNVVHSQYRSSLLRYTNVSQYIIRRICKEMFVASGVGVFVTL